MALKKDKDDIVLLILTCCELKAEKEEKDRLLLVLKCSRLRDCYNNFSNKLFKSKQSGYKTLITLTKNFDNKTDANYNK